MCLCVCALVWCLLLILHVDVFASSFSFLFLFWGGGGRGMHGTMGDSHVLEKRGSKKGSYKLRQVFVGHLEKATW